MKFFIINLEQDIKKREKITAFCESFGLDYEIIPAVYGKALSKDEIKQNTYPKNEQLKLFKRELGLGEIGCAISHRKCYEEIIKRDLKEAIILEDDAVFNEELIEFLKHIDELPKDLELLLLGHYKQMYYDDGFMIDSPYYRKYSKVVANKWKIRRLVGGGNGTHGYLITNDGAKKLSKLMNKIYLPADWYTNNDKHTNVYALFPTIINPDLAEFSSTQLNPINKKRSKISKYFKLVKNKIQFFIPSLKKPKDYI